MYNTLLVLHSFFRWLVLLSLLWSVLIAWQGWLGKKSFTGFCNTLRHVTATIAHIQLIFGVWLYLISPLIAYFLSHYQETVHERSIRFFGMEHSSMMFISILLITAGSVIAKRKSADIQKFRTMAIWYSVALIIILVNIPWPFSPMSGRPWLRGL